MLFGLLSGVRNVRSPIIVGYVMVGALWLLLYHLVPEHLSGFKHDYPELSRVFNVVGPVGTVAAVSLAAFLIGDVVVRESARLMQISGQPVEASRSRVRNFFLPVYSMTADAGNDDLDRRLDDLVSRTITGGDETADTDALRAKLQQRISTRQGTNFKGFKVRRRSCDESNPVELTFEMQVRVEAKSGRIDERILAAKPELYNELSRFRGEAEFRAGLIPSLTLLVAVLMLRVPWPWWGIALTGVSILVFDAVTAREAFSLRSRARGIAIRAVIDELVSTPTLDAIKRERELLGLSSTGASRNGTSSSWGRLRRRIAAG